MIGAAIFVIFFILFLAITVGMPELPPGNMIQTEILNVPPVDYPVLGIPAWILINAILNGVIFGFMVWLMYSLFSYVAQSRKRKEQPVPPPSPVPLYPPPQYSPTQYPQSQYPQSQYAPTTRPTVQYSQPVQPTYTPPPLTPPPQHTPPQYTPPPVASMPQPPASTPAAAPLTEEFSISSANLIDKVTELLKEGNLTKIIIKDEGGKVLMEIPATVGVAGAVIAPWLAGLGGIAALATKCTISVVRPR
jgi:hypothetical protein